MTAQAKNQLTIVRVFDAPREKVWRACREREALRQWWGQPKDATMPFCSVDFRVGGSLHFEARQVDGTGVWVKCIYREIIEGEKLVMEQHMSDESGTQRDSADWPASLITLRFEDVNGRTKLTITHAEMASAAHPIEQYGQGWSQSLDRLADSLSRAG
jgi:uncharacterized protein YndB with AHSA1/START domain